MDSVVFHLHVSHIRVDVSPVIADLAVVHPLILVCEAVQKVLGPVLALQGEAVEVPEVGQLSLARGHTGQRERVSSINSL